MKIKNVKEGLTFRILNCLTTSDQVENFGSMIVSGISKCYLCIKCDSRQEIPKIRIEFNLNQKPFI